MDAAVVWVDGKDNGALPDSLQNWAATRGLRLVQPKEGGRHAIAVDVTLGTRVEDSLHQARELLAQHDADGAERALAHAEALLRAHPELPQAAWLLAEVERGFAARFLRLEPIDVSRAQRHWRAAGALDGGRAAGVGEPSLTGDPRVAFLLDVNGDAEDVRLDGELVTSGNRDAPAGLHQLVAKVSGEVVFAQWISIAAQSTVHVVLPSPEPCSRADLTAAQVGCLSWIAVRHGDRPEAFVVKSCVQSSCGAEVVIAHLPRFTDGNGPATHHGLPKWAAWTLGGAGVVAAVAVVSVIAWFATPVIQQTTFVTTGPPNGTH